MLAGSNTFAYVNIFKFITMKKIFGTLALALCLTAMVSCGGDKKSNSFSKAKVEHYYEKMMEIEARGDRDAAMELMEEMTSWYNSLSDADKKKADDYMDELRGI